MGTNYYAVSHKCSSCGRYERKHIGKKSAGWMFSFRGHRWDHPPIMSASDWRAELVASEIVDEYGEAVEVDRFWLMVEASKSEKMNHHDYCRDDPKHAQWFAERVSRGEEWKDAEGFSFSNGEFS